MNRCCTALASRGSPVASFRLDCLPQPAAGAGLFGQRASIDHLFCAGDLPCRSISDGQSQRSFFRPKSCHGAAVPTGREPTANAPVLSRQHVRDSVPESSPGCCAGTSFMRATQRRPCHKLNRTCVNLACTSAGFQKRDTRSLRTFAQPRRARWGICLAPDPCRPRQRSRCSRPQDHPAANTPIAAGITRCSRRALGKPLPIQRRNIHAFGTAPRGPSKIANLPFETADGNLA